MPIGTNPKSQKVTFKSFQKAFLENLNSEDFGEEPQSQQPGIQSPAAKELRLKGALAAFSTRFLRSVYRLMGRRAKLVNEQPKVFHRTEKNAIKIIKLGNALRTIRTVGAKLHEVQNNTQGLVSGEVWRRLQDALLECESEVRKLREYCVAQLHPAERNPHDSIGHWEPVLRFYDYDLSTLKKKAPDQWLYETLNDSLRRQLGRFAISEITRYRIMSAMLASYGLHIKTITLKLYFHSKKSSANSAVKKS